MSLTAFSRRVFAARTLNFLVTETVHNRTLADELVTKALRVEGGSIPLPTEPGLGAELNEDTLVRHPGNPKDMRMPKKTVY